MPGYTRFRLSLSRRESESSPPSPPNTQKGPESGHFFGGDALPASPPDRHLIATYRHLTAADIRKPNFRYSRHAWQRSYIRSEKLMTGVHRHHSGGDQVAIGGDHSHPPEASPPSPQQFIKRQVAGRWRVKLRCRPQRHHVVSRAGSGSAGARPGGSAARGPARFRQPERLPPVSPMTPAVAPGSCNQLPDATCNHP